MNDYYLNRDDFQRLIQLNTWENDDDEEEDDGDEEEQEHDNTIENDPMIKLTKTPTKKIPAKKFRIKQTHFLIFTFLYHDEII
ncbi:unnamed protein product [Rotaria sordida]|uniref:Uncharacterized protein n=1 Tax=Rotaria sordida TaxID=392033 RepID=A0A819ZNP7_9BILA|nr:unnamed protein product [Rotaria sordida]